MSAETLIWTSLKPKAPLMFFVRRGDGHWQASTAPAAEGPSILLLDARDISTSSAEIPAKNQRQAEAAAPFMIEDQLATGLEGTHIAISGKQAGSDRRDIAWAAADALQQLLDRLSIVGINPIGVLSEASLCPENSSVTAVSDRLLVRTADGMPYGLDSCHTELAIQLAAQVSTQIGGPDGGTPSPASPKIIKVDSLSQLLGFSSISDMIGTGVNLMQGAFAPKKDYSAIWLMWRSPARIFVAALALFSISYVVEIIATEQKAAAIDADATRLMQQAFPGVRNEAHMRQRLAQSQSSAADMFLTLSSILLSAVEATDDVKLGSMRYNADNQTMDINVDAGRYDRITALKKALEAGGARVQEGASRSTNGRLEAALKISGDLS